MRFGSEVVAERRASKRVSVQYLLVPSMISVVERPRVEVESCCQPPPAYVPRRIPAAVGEPMPVPPREAAKVPVHEGVKVWVFASEVIVKRIFASEDVANVCETPV